MTRGNRSRHVAAAAAISLLASCDLPTIGTPDDGFALITGDIRRVSGAPVTSGTVFYLCGSKGPTNFGADVPINSKGRYRIEADAPELSAPPMAGDPFLLRCRINWPGGSPPLAIRYVEIQFSRAEASRPVTEVDLVEGVKETPPEGWELP